jgi:hypothetical protein
MSGPNDTLVTVAGPSGSTSFWVTPEDATAFCEAIDRAAEMLPRRPLWWRHTALNLRDGFRFGAQ